MATPNALQCQDELVLQRLLAEQLSEAEESAVLAHIESCEICRDRLAAFSGHGELAPEIREHFSSGVYQDPGEETLFQSDVESGAEVAEVEQIKTLLGPTEDPHMLGRIGHYEINAVIGRGSTGIVFKALDKRLNRFVAIKMLAPSYAGSGATRQRFEREARSIAAVRDEHVIPVFAVDEHKSLPFIVMEYMPAGSLAQRIETQGTLETCEVVRIGMQIARALEAAHAQGIVHRDVKPANVLLETGVDRALVTDFGLARVADEASMTRSGAISGTPQFMSPEQASGENVDHRSDLFSLGSVLYMACTGHSPFRSETVFGVIKRVCESQPRPVRETNPAIQEWLCDFIAKLQAKSPVDRFQSAKEVADLLAEELAHLQSPTTHPKPERAWRPTRLAESVNYRSMATLGASTVLLAALGVFAWSQLFQDGGKEEQVQAFARGVADQSPSPFASSENDAIENRLAPSTEVVVVQQTDSNPQNKASAYDKGVSAFNAKDYEGAINFFNLARFTQDLGGKAEYNLACCYALTDRPDDAFSWLNKAFGAGYHYPNHYRTDKDLDGLRDDPRFAKLLDNIKDYGQAEAMTTKGIQLRQQGQYAEAEQIYAKVLEDHPEHEHAIMERGLTLHLQGKLDEAIVWHRRAAETKSYDQYGLYNIACYHSLKGNPDAAFVFFDKAIEAGMVDIMHFEEDEDLDPIRKDSRYEETLRKAEKYSQHSWSKKELSCYEIVDAVREKNYSQIALLLKETDPDCSMPTMRFPKHRFVPSRWTPLCEAAKLGDAKSAQLLIDAGAKADGLDRSEATPLMIAASEGNVEIAKFLLDSGAKLDRSVGGVGTAVGAAAQTGELKMLRFLVSSGAKVNRRVDGVGTPLIMAISENQIESVKFLLESKAEINLHQVGIGTALSEAAKQGRTDMIQFLLAQGADVNAATDVGTPLSAAVQAGAKDCVVLLLKRGADIDGAESSCGTPLTTAVLDGDLGLTQLLIDSKADLDAKIDGVGTALCIAVKQGQLETAKLLLASGADPDVAVDCVGTPLALAVEHNEPEMVKLLLSFGADPTTKAQGCKSALELARKRKNSQLLDLLSEPGSCCETS